METAEQSKAHAAIFEQYQQIDMATMMAIKMATDDQLINRSNILKQYAKTAMDTTDKYSGGIKMPNPKNEPKNKEIRQIVEELLRSTDKEADIEKYYKKIQSEELNQELLRAKGAIPEISDYLAYKIFDTMKDEPSLLSAVLNADSIDNDSPAHKHEIDALSKFFHLVNESDLFDSVKSVISKLSDITDKELSISRNIYLNSFIKQATDVTIELEETFDSDDLEGKPIKTVRKSTFRYQNNDGLKNVSSEEKASDKNLNMIQNHDS